MYASMRLGQIDAMVRNLSQTMRQQLDGTQQQLDGTRQQLAQCRQGSDARDAGLNELRKKVADQQSFINSLQKQLEEQKRSLSDCVTTRNALAAGNDPLAPTTTDNNASVPVKNDPSPRPPTFEPPFEATKPPFEATKPPFGQFVMIRSLNPSQTLQLAMFAASGPGSPQPYPIRADETLIHSSLNLQNSAFDEFMMNVNGMVKPFSASPTVFVTTKPGGYLTLNLGSSLPVATVSVLGLTFPPINNAERPSEPTPVELTLMNSSKQPLKQVVVVDLRYLPPNMRREGDLLTWHLSL